MIVKQMHKDERRRRRAILHELKDKERSQFISSVPMPAAAVRELFDYLERGDDPCDNTLNQTLGFLKERGFQAERIVPWLEEHGGFCDCEVLANVEDVWNQMAEKEWQRS
jgi:hypothetical protein